MGVAEAVDFYWRLHSLADYGHCFRVERKATVLRCARCDAEYPNDARFDYKPCPAFYTEDGELREKPDNLAEWVRNDAERIAQRFSEPK